MSDGGESERAAQRPARCPICGKPTSDRYRPFCSKRCADIDLARWLGGTYVIPSGNTDADEDGDEAASGPPAKETRDADD
jgi:endogenous inhibitor of DNA gyrase (YacG/DUF329 family)